MITTQKVLNGKFSLEMHTYGSGGEPLLFMHGAGGLMPVEPFLEDLGKHFKVYAPQFPGYGDSTGNEYIDDIADAVLFYHELMDELGIPTANIVGHSMGGMLAAEVAAFDIHRAKKLVLIAPAGFWIDETPIPDLFAAQLTEIAPLLFHDPNSPAAQLMTAIPSDFKALETMYVERVKRLATASKFLWPIPDRGLKKRAYRIHAPTLLLWGDDDKLIPPVYAKEFTSRIKNSKLELIKNAGHMVMYEQQEALVAAVRNFLKG
jgi:pimeloyl-ACP methyl ester carboxylesterase